MCAKSRARTLVSLFQYRLIQQQTVCPVGAEGDFRFIGFHGEEIVCFRLRGDGDVEGVVCPEIRVADVAGDTGQDVEGAGFISFKIFDVAAISVGVEMGGEDGVDAERVEEGHEGEAFFGEAFEAFRAAFDAVLQRVAVHEDNFPRFLRRCHVLPQPCFLCGLEIRIPFGDFRHVRIEDGEMDRAPIKGPEKFAVIRVAVSGQGKVGEETLGAARFPVQGVGFVIAHERGDGDLLDGSLDGGEPRLPLVLVLAVVDEVAHHDKEIGGGKRGESFDGGVFPHAVIGRLGIGENERGEFSAVVCPERHPGGGGVFGARAVFVGRAGTKAGRGGFVKVAVRFALRSGQELRRGGEGENRAASFLSDFQRRGNIVGELPDDGPFVRVVCGNDLPHGDGFHGGGDVFFGPRGATEKGGTKKAAQCKCQKRISFHSSCTIRPAQARMSSSPTVGVFPL